MSTLQPSPARQWELITLLPSASPTTPLPPLPPTTPTTPTTPSSSPLLQGDLSPSLHTSTARYFLAHVAKSAIASAAVPTQLPDLPSSSPDSAYEALEVVAASLSAFVQLNWTGPSLPQDLQPAKLLRWADPSAFPPRSVTGNDDDDGDAQLEENLNASALDLLTWNGEPAYHLCEHPFYLAFALKVLDSLDRFQASNSNAEHPALLESLPWWRLRAASLHNRILDTPVPMSASILAPVDALLNTLSQRQGQSTAHAASWRLLHARLLTERGLAHSRLGQDKEANDYYARAGQATGLKYELSGALGKRTKFQKVEKTQLVVLAESSEEALAEGGAKEASGESIGAGTRADADADADKDGEQLAEEEEKEDEVGALPNSGWKSAPAADQQENMPANYALNDDTLLEQTKFTSNAASTSISHRDPGNQPPLAPLDQCILLALCLSIGNTAPENGLTSSQISAFVSRVAQHPRNWSVYTMALLLRSRLEATRTRTAERAVLQLQALLDQMPTSDSSPQERLQFFWTLDLPSKWEMQAELAKRYALLGVVRSALEIFERIELWEEVVTCLGSLGRQEQGIEVLRDLLEGRKIEASEAIAARRDGGGGGGGAAPPPATTTSNAGPGPGPSPLRRSRLNTARQAKLRCLLGDLEPSLAEEHYLSAWRISGSRSSRAARSLGGFYFAQPSPDYTLVISWLRRAVRISSLMPRSWFMLGCAYMRRQEWGKAARSFRRVVSIDEDDGEAWNNVASCYLRMVDGATVEDIEADDPELGELGDAELGVGGGDGDGDAQGYDSDASTATMSTARGSVSSRTDSAVEMSSASSEVDSDSDSEQQAQRLARRAQVLTPFILKSLSHRCLRHALRTHGDSWRVWENYMIVSVDVGQLGEACLAMTRVTELRIKASRAGGSAGAGAGRLREEDVDWAVLERLVQAVVRSAPPTRAATGASTSTSGGGEAAPIAPAQTKTESSDYAAATSTAVSVPIGSPSSSSEAAPTPTPTPAPTPTPTATPPPLYRSLLHLITSLLQPSLPLPRLFRAQARLLTWEGSSPPSSILSLHLSAFRHSLGGDPERTAEIQGDGSLSLWREAVRDVMEVVDLIEALGVAGGETEKEVKFKGRSLVRGFMARFREEPWMGSGEWERLEELRERLK